MKWICIVKCLGCKKRWDNVWVWEYVKGLGVNLGDSVDICEECGGVVVVVVKKGKGV